MTLIDLGLMAFAVLVFAVCGQMLATAWDRMEQSDD